MDFDYWDEIKKKIVQFVMASPKPVSIWQIRKHLARNRKQRAYSRIYNIVMSMQDRGILHTEKNGRRREVTLKDKDWANILTV